ncbi:heterokaryon incompatibility protein-domain-containing protein [Clohesyomyces aquaticus]|uniref:Heterokaryon incompatibility protein-domain-containing protein n=1 Tax=Clohesyomyces aquaticus TaxID=1231657 RepID=A0A1Y1ZVE8_9PLEO|nr:heterokaryon incompatibility protein-domain-containing protein [Clohesyomyces aquaticus]
MRFRNILQSVRVTQNLHFPRGSYQYDPLPTTNHIRLLELAPSSDAKVVRCSLKPFELHNAPPFQSLSYTWGNHLTLPNQASASSKIRRSTTPGPDVSAHIRRYPIICDGRLFPVTRNLRDALRMLTGTISSKRGTSNSTYYFWIDALCVNQQDIAERNSQVAKMAEIFKASQSVVVWLGKEDEFTDDAIETIDRVSQIQEEDWPLIPYTSFYQSTVSTPSARLNLTFYNWLGFIALINRPWFKRAWVVQEIALAKSAKVVCGTKVFPWEKLSKTLSFIKATKWYHHLHTEKLKHIRSIRKQPGVYKSLLQAGLQVGISPIYLDATRLKMVKREENALKPSLRMLLETHRFSNSTDPRDKVYAFLGLADRSTAPFRSQPDILSPNYNLSVQEVYTETARAFLTSFGNLSVLSHVQDPSRTRISGLPSWVPDYSVNLDPYPLQYRSPSLWKASGGRKWKINAIDMEHGLLDVQGYRLSVIDQVSVLTTESQDPSAAWASIVKLALSLDQPYTMFDAGGKSPSRIEVVWKTLTTNTYNKQYPAPSSTGMLFIDYVLNLQIRHRLTPWSSTDEFQPHHSPLSESIYPEWNTLLCLEPSNSPYSLKVYKERLCTVVESMFNGTYSPIGLAQLQHEFDESGGRKRRLFRTQNNYLGTGPRSLGQGDEVFVLDGGNVPFVLRRLTNGNWRLIGEAYVHGAMHGETLDLGLPRQSITIE